MTTYNRFGDGTEQFQCLQETPTQRQQRDDAAWTLWCAAFAMNEYTNAARIPYEPHGDQTRS